MSEFLDCQISNLILSNVDFNNADFYDCLMNDVVSLNLTFPIFVWQSEEFYRINDYETFEKFINGSNLVIINKFFIRICTLN